MRKTLPAILLAASLLWGPAACKRRDRAGAQHTEEEAPQLATIVHAADPRTAAQFVSGFHDIEQNAWRWTAGRFAVVLRVPRGAAEKGAVLRLKFSVPEPVVEKLKTVTLRASIEGTGFEPESFTQAGEFTYEREIPAALMTGESTRVEFSLDRALPAGEIDRRELGVIVSSVGFEIP